MDLGVKRGWRATSLLTLYETGFAKQSEALPRLAKKR